MFVFLDTPFDPDFPVYTRANAGEILPAPISPLGWSVCGAAFEEGFRIAFCDDFGLVPRPGPDRPFQMVGRMAGRFHLNLSVIRTTAQRLPGTSADVVDVQYFGDAAVTGLPRHEGHADDRRYRLKAPSSLGRTLAGVGRRVDRDRGTVDELVAELDAAFARDADEAELVFVLRHVAATFGRLLGTHITCRALTSPLLEQATAALVRNGIAEADALRYVASIPDLESSKPARELAAIARTLPPGSPLAAFVAGASLDDLARSPLPGAATVHAELVRFVHAHGHRGLGEFDPTNPAWAQDPDQLLRLLTRMPRTPAEPAEPPDADPGRLARPLVAAARSAMARAERTKDTAMRSTNLLRRILFTLRDRWSDRVDADRFLALTVSDVEAVANGGRFPTDDELARRVDEFAATADVMPAEWSDGRLRLDDAGGAVGAAGRARAGDSLAGIAGSPGTVTGRVRVLADPFGDDLEDGEILVTHMTDIAWTPLFLAAAGVVTDVGGVLSHATIVARDLGIPAVVNTKTATTALHTGDVVRVDGAGGVVTVVESGR